MKLDLISPKLDLETFNCPHCGALSHAKWLSLLMNQYGQSHHLPQSAKVAITTCCPARMSLWLEDDDRVTGTMIFPASTIAPLPHPDMPDDIARDFEEARLVFTHSPRAAAALLRLCVQKICNHLMGKPGGIDEQIGQLVADGLPRRVQQALDSVRVIGNESVHPGKMDLNDTPEVGQVLFRLVNLIIQDCITAPKEAEEIYGLLPEGKLKGIENRDKPKA